MGTSADTLEGLHTKVPQMATADAHRLFYLKLSPGAYRCVYGSAQDSAWKSYCEETAPQLGG